MMETNPQLDLAYDFLESTGTSVFLTGKAGTGKTTFLRELKKRSPKRMIVVAPTGVAAINAGGVTIHSFFQLPFGPYIPGSIDRGGGEGSRFVHRLGKEKINIIRSMDLLVIDEISMVRADLLDAVSDMLRKYRDREKPFGGVQLLMIGDLQQLAPVVKEEEWELLKATYDSPFFFASRALKEVPYVSIELLQVYRQSDDRFIRLLNKIRENRADAGTLQVLNQRYIPGFNPDDADGFITLTTHNYQAQQINKRKLEQLESRPYIYKAEIKDEFPDYAFPTDEQLVLKKGAQVMFVKNDSSPEKRYYNGKIGRITAISNDNIMVRCGEEKEAIAVTREEWTNTKYTLDAESQEITETVAGVFRQYPLKTAWAITIHKSQGLTFERAIVDAGAAFTHGQVYVALSRCKSLEGLVLGSPLRPGALINDLAVESFTKGIAGNQPTPEQLSDARRAYYLQLLKELFDYHRMSGRIQYLTRLFGEHLWKLYPELTGRCRVVRDCCLHEMTEVGERFQIQLQRMVMESRDYEQDASIRDRVCKGVLYFKEKLQGQIMDFLENTHPEIDNKDVRKAIEEALLRLQQEADLKMTVLEAVAGGFSVNAYLSARARAMIEKPKIRSRKSVGKISPVDDVLHPQLYQTLRLWRNEEAKKQGLPAYTILQQKAILGIANTLPSNGREMLNVPGIGKKILERYGAVLLEMVDEFRFRM